MSERACREHGCVFFKLLERAHDCAGKHPGDAKSGRQHDCAQQRAPAQLRCHCRKYDVLGKANGDEPGNAMRGRGTGEADDAVGPSQFLARFLGGDKARDVGGARKIATDPIWTVDALSNHDPALIDDFDHAAGRKGVKAQGVLEMIEPSAGDQNGVQSAGAIFNPPGNVDDPLLGRAPDVDFAERDTLPGQYLAKCDDR